MRSKPYNGMSYYGSFANVPPTYHTSAGTEITVRQVSPEFLDLKEKILGKKVCDWGRCAGCDIERDRAVKQLTTFTNAKCFPPPDSFTLATCKTFETEAMRVAFKQYSECRYSSMDGRYIKCASSVRFWSSLWGF